MRNYYFDPNPYDITLTCPICGVEFKPRAKNAKYCSKECKKQSDREQKKKRRYESNKA